MEDKKDILNHIKVTKIELPSDAYFTELASGVISSTSKRNYMTRILYLSISAAAILILAWMFIVPDSDSIQKESGSVSFADLDEKEIKEYIVNQGDDYRIPDSGKGPIIDTIKKPVQGMSTEKLEKAFSELSEEDILQFFNEQGLDPEEMEEEEEILIF